MKRSMLALLLLCSSLPVVAELQRTSLLALEMEAWRARMGFHQLAVRGNAPEDIEKLEKVLHHGESLLAVLRDQAVTTAEKESVTRLTATWKDLGRRALHNPLASDGYADYHAFEELNSLTLALHREVAARQGSAVKGEHDELLSLGVRLLRLASEYIAVATFPSAGINTGTQEPQMAFDREAMEFEGQLNGLAAAGVGGERARQALSTLKMRWTFIRGAIPQLDDPAAARVPLLFYRYSSESADDLLALTDTL